MLHRLGDNQIAIEGAEHLGEALRVNTCLKALEYVPLMNQYLYRQTFQICMLIVHCYYCLLDNTYVPIHMCTYVYVYRLGENTLGSDGARLIAKALETNACLRSIGYSVLALYPLAIYVVNHVVLIAYGRIISEIRVAVTSAKR